MGFSSSYCIQFDGLINEWTYRAEDETEECDANPIGLALKCRSARRRACGLTGGARNQKQRRPGPRAGTVARSSSPPSDEEPTTESVGSSMGAGHLVAPAMLPFAASGSGSGSGSGESSESDSPDRRLLRLLYRVTSSSSSSDNRLPSLRQLLEAESNSNTGDADVPCPPSQPLQPDSNGDELSSTEQHEEFYEDPSLR